MYRILITDENVEERSILFDVFQNFDEEFEIYRSHIYSLYVANPDIRFVVGDYQGVDIMAQNFLLDDIEIDPENITVYHMFEVPRNANPKVKHFKGGFLTDSERDTAMTNASAYDIAYVRNNKKISGTAENILRRFTL